ncbi:Ppx/GppA family phosphatase [Rhizobacter sp. J219]|uniref:Ppx/GppA phosphatase family protein n=1 Tax=Rhizobacter sp. J219 TaxID=2898430 RepID=UPI0021508CCD|nr:Ppx/GppA phosphatase family protein [Rhizobacter sp. J219]MCR5883203.1 Ppx/GppA family phosphatase [Rhizobacter sp. J219]
MTDSLPPPSGVLAAIDMGSNSFRLEIAQLSPGRYKRIDYLKETVRLGAGLDEQGLLTEDAMQRGLACLQRFAKRLEGVPSQHIRAVATQTLREARNRDAFLLRARAALGQPIEVISGREEARLIFAGVARLQPSDEWRLVIDIGGRSTEMILGQGRMPLRAESFQVGSVSLSMRYFGDGRFTEGAFRAAQVAAGAELEEALAPFASRHWREALGSSGTAGAVSQLLAASGITDGVITPDGLRWCMEQCLRAGRIDKLSLPGLKEDRRAVIGGGLSILYTLATHFDIAELQPARGALRQGVIYDLDERLSAAAGGTRPSLDARDASVAELQQRFEVDVPQARRVADVALALHAAVTPSADPALARELGWAAALHELGMMVSHHDHHRHSAYLLGHVDAAGFSQSQQRRLADLVLAQRGGLRKVEAQLAQETFAWQALCLRLAIILCHARTGAQAEVLTLQRRGTQAELAVPPGWAATHPRTLFLLNEEAAVWERSGALRLQIQA